MEFLQELNEARLMLSKRNVRTMTAREAADMAFIHILILQMFRHEFHQRPFAVDYAKRTYMGGNLQSFRTGSTDLYNLVYMLAGRNAEQNASLFKDPEASKAFIETISFDKQFFRRWILMAARNQTQESFDRRFLLHAQNAFDVKDSHYKALRRLIGYWDEADYERKRLVTTRLLMAIRAHALRSDMRPELERFAKRNKLELRGKLCNPETGKGCDGGLSPSQKALGYAGAIAGGAVLGTYLAKRGKD